MGVIEGTYITLTNYKKKKIEELERGEKLLSCKIEDLKPMSHSNIAMSWTKKDPTILKKNSHVESTSRDPVAIYRIINDKLAISLDHVIFTKDGETDECSWNNVKSLRRGDFIFNEFYEFEEITSLKKIKKDVSTMALSLSGYPYYFANGYLIHNYSPCEDCNKCFWWQRIFTPFGPHTWDDNTNPCYGGHHNDTTGFFKTQKYAHDNSRTITIANEEGFVTSNTIPWNQYTGKLYYSLPSGWTAKLYLYKGWDGWRLTETKSEARMNAIRTKPLSPSYHKITYAGYVAHDTYRSEPKPFYTGDANATTYAEYGSAGTENDWYAWPITSTTNTSPGGNPNMMESAGVTVDTFRMYYEITPGEAYIWRIYKEAEYGANAEIYEPASGWAHVREYGT
tara:strand:- start:15096 stop:16280 length:1185 start_codon:yes stop_codon:yes gene_type:complete